MCLLINLSALILAIGFLQVSTLKKDIAELLYPILLQGQTPPVTNKVSTGNTNPELTYLQRLLYRPKDKPIKIEKPNKISVFDSSTLTNHVADEKDKIMPFQDLTIETVDNRSNQKKELHRITVFDSSIPTKYEEDREDKKVSFQGLTINTADDELNQNKKTQSHRNSDFDSSIPKHENDLNSRRVFLQGMDIDGKAELKKKPHHISVFDVSTPQDQEGVEESIEMHSQGLSIPIKAVHNVNPEVDLHRTSIIEELKKEETSDEESDESESEEMESEEDYFMFDSKSDLVPNKQKNDYGKPKTRLHRISVFDAAVLPNSEDDEAKMEDTTRTNTLQKHRRKLLNRRKGYHSIPVLYTTPVPSINQTSFTDPYLNTSIVTGKTKQSNIKRKHKRKKKLKKKNFVFDSNTILDYGDSLVHIGDNYTVADALAKDVKVLCWVMTYPGNHNTRARHVKETWGKRCNKLLFMSTAEDPSLPSVNLHVKEGYNFLWGKTKAAFQYIHKHHFTEADWFLKADDDTYVIVENVRYMLAYHSKEDPIYFGFRFKLEAAPKQGYASGGGGYILSSKALDLLVTKGLSSPDLCNDGAMGTEDIEMGICLEKTGVKLMDSRDDYRRERFFPMMPHDIVDSRFDADYWLWKRMYYPMASGRDCCSEYAISFHFITPPYMYVLEYFIYHLRPHGISYNYDLNVNKISD